MLQGLHSYSIALLLIPVASRVTSACVARARSWGLLAHPGGRHLHPRPVATVGGIAVMATWALGIAATCALHGDWARANLVSLAVTASGMLAVLAVGLADDVRGVTPRVRLVSELAIAALTVWLHPGVHAFCSESAAYLGPSSYPLTAIGLVAVMNAMNLVDGIDGLAACMFLSIAGAIAYLSGHSGSSLAFVPVASLMLVPGLVAFLRRNWSPATAFMGDHGSLSIGYLLAVLALCMRDRGAAHSARDLIVLSMLFGYPMLDMVICMIRRVRLRQPVFVGDRNHMHHRVLRLGLSTPESTASLVAWQVSMISPVLLIPNVTPGSEWGLLFVALAVAAERLVLLHRLELVRLRALQEPADGVRDDGAPRSADSRTNAVCAEIVISLRPVLEAAQYEEPELLEQIVNALRFFCERKVKDRGWVQVGPDQVVVSLSSTSGMNASARELRAHWSECLATFTRAFEFKYSTWSLPVEVREPSAGEQEIFRPRPETRPFERDRALPASP